MDEYDVASLTSQLEALGSHPDKAKINAITMLAEDYADDSVGANDFFAIIRGRMLSVNTSNLFKLPLVYLVDSILNNAKGEFISIIEETITSIFLSVYTKIDDLSKKKFARLLTFWKKNKMFSADKINAMEGICAGDSFNLESLSKDDLCDLRAMLESMEEDVSLEDLVAKNPDFVKQMFDNLAVFREEREKHEEAAAQEMSFWEGGLHDIDLSEANSIMKKLEDLLLTQVRGGEGEGDSLLVAAAGTKKYLHTLVTSFKNKAHEEMITSVDASTKVDPADFTSQMLGHNTKKNDNVIFALYGALPFLSRVDGRRFNSQILLKEHIDDYLTKVDELTSTFNSFGWFQSEEEWITKAEGGSKVDEEANKDGDNDEEENSGRKDMVEADEMRDKCMICGKKFVNVYDDDECVYFSQDCREVVVEEDNGMETDEVLVHASCCKKLGLEIGEALPRTQVFTE
mmetsp:Transcript_19083/g.39750  ORF Transcript_19083/g.39750 Transcript_19083/m.39750 type:complete len:458 (+) Transcript_19083:4-1377(+)